MESVGAALKVASRLPGVQGRALTGDAASAFVHGLTVAHAVGFAVALVGAGAAYAFLPAGMRVGAPSPTNPDEVAADEPIDLTVPEALATEVDA